MDSERVISYEMEYLMRLFSCAVKGEAVPAPEQEISWDVLIELARRQTVTLTVAAALCKSPGYRCPDKVRESLYGELIGTALKRRLQQDKIFSLLDRLQESGVRYILLKGADVARYYNLPECRISGDTDILISPEDEQKAYDFFKGEGLFVKPCEEWNNHAECRNTEYGLIELHLKLFPEVVEKYMFPGEGIEAEAREAEICGHTLNVLKPTDAAVFLTLHLVKHFICSGINLRTLMDTALYICNNADEIDFDYFRKIADRLGNTKIIAMLFTIAVEHFGMDKNRLPCMDAPVSREQVDLILQDTELGGYLGADEGTNRMYVFWKYVDTKAIRSKPLPLRVLMRIGVFIRQTFRAVFPTVKWLSNRYPDVLEHRWKYPFYVLHRLISLPWERLRSGKLKRSIQVQYTLVEDVEQRRLSLFKKLEIL